MSDWSSFEGDKNITDLWRSFLNEEINEEELEEGLFSGAGKMFSNYSGYLKDLGATLSGKGKTVKLPDEEEDPEEDPVTPTPVDVEEVPDADSPLSVSARQKNLPGGKEQPISMQLQQLGLSQRVAQKLATRIAQYLKQRKIPVAEHTEPETIEEATNTSRIKSHLFNRLRDLTRPNQPEDRMKVASQYILGIFNVADQPDPEKFRDFLGKRFGGFPGTVEELTVDELKDLMNYVKTSPKLKKYHKKGFEFRQGKKAANQQARADIRQKADALGGRGQIIGKIITRFVSDNRRLLDADPALKAIFADKVKLNKLVKAISRNLARQMKRRGYEDQKIGTLLENIILNEINGLLNE